MSLSVGVAAASAWRNARAERDGEEPLYIQALELLQRLLGEADPSVATSFNNLAGLYYSQGRYSEAESLYQKILSIAELSLEDVLKVLQRGFDYPSY
jgi:tetratricopeptide (TPR) repeat protein